VIAMLLPAVAAADPQLQAGVTLGGGARDLRDGVRGAFALGLRGSALFFRHRNRDGGLGAYVEGLTLDFDDVQLGGGVEGLLPGLESTALVLSAGALARHAPAAPDAAAPAPGWQPGFVSRLFVGFREYDFHSAYAMANGLFVEGRLGVGESRQAEIIGGAQIDLALFALPVLLVWGALR
jgi:hypothetical protein